jgi:hypothetical protein
MSKFQYGVDWWSSEELVELLEAENEKLRAIVQRVHEECGPSAQCADCGAYNHSLRDIWLAADKALNPTGEIE